ncbi:hypothetical protein D3C73_1624590 [compost metagenome]
MSYCTMLVGLHGIQEMTDIAKIRKIEMITVLVVEKVLQHEHLEHELFEITNADKCSSYLRTNL